MGRVKQTAKNYVVNKWQNSFHYIVLPLSLISYQCPKHNIYICILCFLCSEGPPTDSSSWRCPLWVKPPAGQLVSPMKHLLGSVGPLSHPGLTSSKLAKGAAQHFSFYFPSELNLATWLWSSSVSIITYLKKKEHLEMTLSASTYIDKRALFNFQTCICGIWVSLSSIYRERLWIYR